jgi:biopolymer transport protein ExbD
MLITPTRTHGLDARIPSPAAGATGEQRDIVASIDANRAVTINAQPVAWQDLGDRFREIFARRAQKLLFVTAAPLVDFDDVARVIDTARGVGVEQIALMPRQRIEASRKTGETSRTK